MCISVQIRLDYWYLLLLYILGFDLTTIIRDLFWRPIHLPSTQLLASSFKFNNRVCQSRPFFSNSVLPECLRHPNEFPRVTILPLRMECTTMCNPKPECKEWKHNINPEVSRKIRRSITKIVAIGVLAQILIITCPSLH